MDWDAFFTVHSDLPREGPGCAADVHWALDAAGVSGAVPVCDAGCGPGADLEVLAEALPQARLTGVEMHAGFVQSARSRCARFGDRVTVVQGDMARPGGPYDLIWCAGALYFLGVTEGLSGWRAALAPGGWVAFSEPVLLDGEQPQAVREFWAEYPAITDLAGIAARVTAAGYRVRGHRLIVGAPWSAYYDPLQARIDHLRGTEPDSALGEALDRDAAEIALWRAASGHIAYALMLVQPE